MNKLYFLYIGIFIFFLVSGILEAIPELASDNIRFSSDITMPFCGSYHKDEDVVSSGKSVAGVLFDSQTVGIPSNVEIDQMSVFRCALTWQCVY